MNTRLFGAALAMALLIFPPAVSAQGSRGHARGQASGAAGSHPREERPRGEVAGRTTVFVAPRVVQARPLFARPYYVFQPRASLGFGLFLGYPVPYPRFYSYPNYFSPYPYYPYAVTPLPAYPYGSLIPTYPNSGPVYGSPVAGSNAITIAPGAQNVAPSDPRALGGAGAASVGGVSFQISPVEAAVFVDGVYVGTVNDFSANAPPLSLASGRHHFELRAQGYQTMSFDVDVVPGQVTPYQGTLQAAQP